MHVVLGCGEAAVEWEPSRLEIPMFEEDDVVGVRVVELCEVVLCLAGAGGDYSDGNELLTERCELTDGVVRRCDSEGCEPIFHDGDSALRALEDVTARLVDEEFGRRELWFEPPVPAAEGCRISLVGYSWGAVTATELAARVREAPAIPQGLRRVDRMVLIDTYSPFVGEVVDVPDGVKEAWSYRHSEPTPGDCSSRTPLGPYAGLPIRCGGDSVCADHDLSLAEDDVDHCGIISDVWHCASENLRGQDCTTPPPVVGVARR